MLVILKSCFMMFDIMTYYAFIYRPSKSAMQSGTKNMNQWRLDIRSDDPRFVDPTMGWISRKDTKGQLKMSFDSEEDAIRYCTDNGLNYEIQQPTSRKLKTKSYANNFATHKRRYSDIVAKNKIEL